MDVSKTLKALALTLSTLCASQALAYDGYVYTAGKSTVTFRVGSLAGVTGYGAHFSTGGSSDGMGGYDAECHLFESSGNVFVYCYDGYQDASNHHNQFFMPLGNKAHVTGLTFTVQAAQVRVEATLLTTNPFTTERKPYTVTGLFPYRQSSGFWRTPYIYYQANCVLAGCSSGRPGSGYAFTSISAL